VPGTLALQRLRERRGKNQIVQEATRGLVKARAPCGGAPLRGLGLVQERRALRLPRLLFAVPSKSVVASSSAWLRSMDRVVGRFGRGQGASFLSCPRNPQAAYNPLDTVASTVLATAKSCLSCPPAADSISPQGGPSRRPMGTEIEQPSRMLIVSVLRRISRFVRL
jgi:hypothetical protein